MAITDQAMSCFFALKLDISAGILHSADMGKALESSSSAVRQSAALVRQRIDHGGERLWRLEDFRDLPFSAVAQALSRLTREGIIERLSKGVYYHSRETAFGKSRPNPSSIQKLTRQAVHPSGIAAANLLGFTRKRQDVKKSPRVR